MIYAEKNVLRYTYIIGWIATTWNFEIDVIVLLGTKSVEKKYDQI